MFSTSWGVVRNGKVELTEPAELVEGSRVLVTLVQEDEIAHFWMGASESSLKSVWDNSQDDRYAELLKE